MPHLKAVYTKIPGLHSHGMRAPYFAGYMCRGKVGFGDSRRAILILSQKDYLLLE